MVLYSILDHVVDGYKETAQGVDGDIQKVERQVFSADGNNRDVSDHLRRVETRISGFRELLGSALHANFDNMPELHWRFGYPAVLAIILVACTLLYRRFKRSGWL